MGSQTLSRRTVILTVVVAAVIVTATVTFLPSQPSPLEGVSVSIYMDRGITAASRIALERMFLWMGGGDNLAILPCKSPFRPKRVKALNDRVGDLPKGLKAAIGWMY